MISVFHIAPPARLSNLSGELQTLLAAFRLQTVGLLMEGRQQKDPEFVATAT